MGRSYYDADSTPIIAAESFYDALDEFSADCAGLSDAAEPSTSVSTVTFSSPEVLPEVSSPSSTLRRRPSSRRGSSRRNGSSAGSQLSEISDEQVRFRERRRQISGERKNEDASKDTVVAGVEKVEIVRNFDLTDELDRDLGWLLYVVSFVIKAVQYQLALLAKVLFFPIWVFHRIFILVMNPFSVARHFLDFLSSKLGSLWSYAIVQITPLVGHWFRRHETTLKHLLRFGWGFFWSINVAIILSGFFAFSVMLSGFSMRFLVDKPLSINEDLNFDFSKHSPVAYVPVRHCSGIGCEARCEAMDGGNAWRLATQFVPPKHKMELFLRLILPESEYNRKLGVFQVRVELLSEYGEVHHTIINPFMLKYKSQPIRVLTTFLKIFPVVMGYISESQTLDLKIKNLRIRQVPISCIKVTLEQRAEFRSGAGIPEIYRASLLLQSDLPFFKSVFWYWRKTIFVWITIVSFISQLLIALLCCRNLIIPRRGRGIHLPNNTSSTIILRENT